MGYALCGRMGAVGGAEGVVHINVGHIGQCLGKGRVILFLLLVEAQIFKQQNLASPKCRRAFFRVFTDYILCHDDWFSQQLGQARGDDLQG